MLTSRRHRACYQGGGNTDTPRQGASRKDPKQEDVGAASKQKDHCPETILFLVMKDGLDGVSYLRV